MPRATRNRSTPEGCVYLPAEVAPLSNNCCPSESAGGAHAAGDFADRHLCQWELAWIDIGGEG